MKAPIGYKLKQPEFALAVREVLKSNIEMDKSEWFDDHWDENMKQFGFNFGLSNSVSTIQTILFDAGLLEIWFEPVYHLKTKPIIDGVQFTFVNDEVVIEGTSICIKRQTLKDLISIYSVDAIKNKISTIEKLMELNEDI